MLLQHLQHYCEPDTAEAAALSVVRVPVALLLLPGLGCWDASAGHAGQGSPRWPTRACPGHGPWEQCKQQ
jgi:hypothetical protein